MDEPFLAVCVDLSKAYNSMRLDLLEHLRSCSGLPAEVWRPTLNMARAPRRLKVLSAAGEWHDPTSGVLPGCPAVTFVMSLLLERWRRSTGAAGPATQVRCWEVVEVLKANRGVWLPTGCLEEGNLKAAKVQPTKVAERAYA